MNTGYLFNIFLSILFFFCYCKLDYFLNIISDSSLLVDWSMADVNDTCISALINIYIGYFSKMIT